MQFSKALYSECGIREKNEDAITLLHRDTCLLAVAADSLGGHGMGEIASGRAIQVMEQCFASQPLDEEALAEAIFRANREIVAMHTGGANMKTTIAVLAIQADSAIALHVGDTRIYQFRSGRICFQSRDHSLAQLAVTVGQIPAEDLRAHPDQNKLTRSLGGPERPRIDIRLLEVQPGDSFLLCTDGFWGPVTETQMCDALHNAASAQDWLNRMRPQVQACSRDNHSAIALIAK